MLQNHVAWNSLNSHSSSVFSTLPHQLSHPSAKNSHRPATFRRGLSLLQLPTAWSSLSGTIGTAPKHLHLVNREFLESGKSDLLSARRCSASPCSAWHSEWHKGRGSEMIVEWTVRHLATFKAGGDNRCVRCASLVSMGMTWMGKAKWTIGMDIMLRWFSRKAARRCAAHFTKWKKNNWSCLFSNVLLNVSHQ